MSNFALSEAELVVVGAGFFGATIAERAAEVLGAKVAVLDRRRHVGGNAFSEVDADTGIEVHRYGAHIFHTSNEAVWTYLRRFTEFTPYRHRVFALHRGQMYGMPINLGTICQFFGRAFSPDEAKALIGAQAAELGGRLPTNLEEKAVSSIGRPLYEAFIKGYTQKQWETDPRLLPESVISRLPVRYSFEDGYFSDARQGLPVDGYARIFERMLAHPRIRTVLDADFFAARSELPRGAPIVFTGPIDRYFDFAEGVLGWRTLDFDWEVAETDDHQGTAVVNFSDPDVPWTRCIEFKHFHPERAYAPGRSVLARERSRFAGPRDEPYYPINTPSDRAVFRRYAARGAAEPGVIFGGRLGTYKYLDMHQAVAAALKTFETAVAPALAGRPALVEAES